MTTHGSIVCSYTCAQESARTRLRLGGGVCADGGCEQRKSLLTVQPLPRNVGRSARPFVLFSRPKYDKKATSGTTIKRHMGGLNHIRDNTRLLHGLCLSTPGLYKKNDSYSFVFDDSYDQLSTSNTLQYPRSLVEFFIRFIAILASPNAYLHVPSSIVIFLPASLEIKIRIDGLEKSIENLIPVIRFYYETEGWHSRGRESVLEGRRKNGKIIKCKLEGGHFQGDSKTGEQETRAKIILLVISTSAARYTAEQPLLPRVVREGGPSGRAVAGTETGERGSRAYPPAVMAGSIDRNEMFLET